MIQPLRTIHRRAFVALAFVLPAILFVALGARRAVTPVVPPARLGLTGVLWPKGTVQSSLQGDSGNIAVILHTVNAFNEPDLLLYWTPAAPAGNVLPAEARLLGPFAVERPFQLPRDRRVPGQLVLYSLAHQSIIDAIALENLP